MFRHLMALLAVVSLCYRLSPPAAAEAATTAPRSVNLLADTAPSFAVVEPNLEPVWRDKLELSQAESDAIMAKSLAKPVSMKTRYTFRVGDPSAYAALALAKPVTASEWTLNGKPVPQPLAGQQYSTVPGIPITLLQSDANELIGVWTPNDIQTIRRRQKNALLSSPKLSLVDIVRQPVELLGMTPDMLAVQSGPILGPAGAGFLTVACRMNMPVPVTLLMDGRTFESPAGFYHRFKIEGLKPDTAYSYSLGATCPGRKTPLIRGPFVTRTLPEGDILNFTVVGDNRSYPDIWGEVAQALPDSSPMFNIHTGDLTINGLEDALWDIECFKPAADVFASIPTLAVLGNHEENSQVYYKMFSIPDGATNWVYEIGPALFVGVNDITPQSVTWMDGVLAASKAKFIFMVCHYPIASSSDRSPPTLRNGFGPVLAKYNATAELAGHEHYYERSELPDGLSVIVTGGGGADLYPKKVRPDGSSTNPHSRAFLSDFHFCVLSIKGDTCSLKAMTVDGDVFDSREWKARKLPASPPAAQLNTPATKE